MVWSSCEVDRALLGVVRRGRKKRFLALRILDAAAGDFEILRLDFDARELSTRTNRGDPRRSRSHERIEHHVAVFAPEAHEPVEMLERAAARMTVCLAAARLNLRRHAGNEVAARPAGDWLAETVGNLIPAELATDVAGHHVLQDLRNEERHQRRDGRQEPRVAI